jgi:hypothetical protein
MDRANRGQLKSWHKFYDPADEAKLTAHLNGIRKACEESRGTINAGDFLSMLNIAYMEKAKNPQPDMLRIAPDAAKEILAQNAAGVYRLTREGAEKLTPIDAVRTGLQYSLDREFAIRPVDWPLVEKWARRTAGEILRQAERGGHNKSRGSEL